MASDCEDYAQLKRDIIQCLQVQEQSLSVFRNLIHNKDVVIFLGNTRSGKSTLVNYLIDNDLEAWESGKMDFKIRVENDEDGPEIGQGSLSCTTQPGVYKVKGSDSAVFVDPPGFEDNRGVVQDIINALCISQIRCARTVKFVLVFDVNEITNDNIRNFTNSLQQVQALVSNFDVLKNSFCLVFTKDWKHYTQEEMAQIFRNKILNQDKLDMNKLLVKNFAENQKLIGIFKMPTRAGRIGKELDVNVKEVIKACHEVDVDKCEIVFALSDKAQEALLQVYPEYTDSNFFEVEVNRITVIYDNYFDIDRYVFASYDEELATVKGAMEIIASELRVQQERNISKLSDIEDSLYQLPELNVTAQFSSNFKFVVMLDDSSMLEEKYKEMITTNYLGSLTKLCEKVDAVLQKINTEIGERKTNNIIFTLSGAGGLLGFGPAVVGAAKVLHCAIDAGSKVQKVLQPGVATYAACEATIGGIATTGICIGGAALAGAGGAAAYVLYKETIGKRKQVRVAQGRAV